jgi:hypothetical protein
MYIWIGPTLGNHLYSFLVNFWFSEQRSAFVAYPAGDAQAKFTELARAIEKFSEAELPRPRPCRRLPGPSDDI